VGQSFGKKIPQFRFFVVIEKLVAPGDQLGRTQSRGVFHQKLRLQIRRRRHGGFCERAPDEADRFQVRHAMSDILQRRFSRGDLQRIDHQIQVSRMIWSSLYNVKSMRWSVSRF
jgi:hypothetical protein